MENLQKELVELLHSVAMYNDKGYGWSRHSTAESNTLRLQWRAEIDDLLTRIGRDNFPDALLQQLSSEAATSDGNGIYAEKVESYFASHSRKDAESS